jgi:autophagy-related protein 2
MPDVKRTQLPGVLAGLAPVRSLVNVGSGFKDLIEIPIREYKKDGRIVRSIGKGAAAFARTTGTEIIKLGAKLAVGTQYALQGAEGMLLRDQHGEGSSGGGMDAGGTGAGGWDDDDDEYAGPPEEKKQISLYADQPTGVIQGLRGAYSSLTRDLYMARDAIIAVPGEVMESQSAQGAAKAVLRRAPTIIFRPAIGATKAIGQTLLGATNSLDPENRRRMDAVSYNPRYKIQFDVFTDKSLAEIQETLMTSTTWLCWIGNMFSFVYKPTSPLCRKRITEHQLDAYLTTPTYLSLLYR